LLGGRLAAILARGHAVVGGRHTSALPAGLAEVPLDILSAASIEAALVRVRPEAVVHSAALADADRCQADPELAERVNVRGAENVARACRLHRIRLVALSTDLVFAGDRGQLAESQPAAPILTYGRTKLRGEAAVFGACPGAAVARVALVVGRGHGSKGTASESVAWALAAGRTLRLFTGQYRTPVDAESVAVAIATLLAGSGAGLFHLGGAERISRFDLGLRVARALGLATEAIAAVTQAELRLAAPRPADVSLDSTRARTELGFAPRALETAILEGRAEADIIRSP
jgi:dTDP-4-dehydrorhamnose reductase